MMQRMEYYNQLARKLARGGRLRVVLISYPETPEVFEYIARAGNGKRPTRYINIDAQADANICKIVTR